MAAVLVPVVEGAAEVLGPVLLRAGAALLGGAAVAGTASLSGDKAKDDAQAKPAAITLPRTDESCKKCPADAGTPEKRNHNMTAKAREYQGRITGRPYSVAEGWSEEWACFGIDYDGFLPAECLLQEAKGDYDQFISEPWMPATRLDKIFADIEKQIRRQAKPVNASPPTKLMWYFQGAQARAKVLRTLTENSVTSVVVP